MERLYLWTYIYVFGRQRVKHIYPGFQESESKHRKLNTADPAPKDKTKKADRPIYGVLGTWVKAKNLCIQWQLGKCSSPGDHQSTGSQPAPRHHLCCVCLHSKNKEDPAHPGKDCAFQSGK